MAWISEESILALQEASKDYQTLLDTSLEKESHIGGDNTKYTYATTAEILRKNYEQGELNDEEFVIGFLLDPDHPGRRDFIPYLDEDIPKTLYPLEKQDEPGFLSKTFGTPEDILFNTYASTPPWFLGTARMADMYRNSHLTLTEMDWSTMGKKLFEGDLSGAKEEFNLGWKRYKENYDAGKYDFAGLPIADGLGRVEKFFAERSKRLMEEHQADPKNRAYWQYMKQVKAKDLLMGKDTMSIPEKYAYAASSLASPLLTIGSGVAVGFFTANPALGMQVASSGAFLLEGIDEWQQSFDYYTGLGYSPCLLYTSDAADE